MAIRGRATKASTSSARTGREVANRQIPQAHRFPPVRAEPVEALPADCQIDIRKTTSASAGLLAARRRTNERRATRASTSSARTGREVGEWHFGGPPPGLRRAQPERVEADAIPPAPSHHVSIVMTRTPVSGPPPACRKRMSAPTRSPRREPRPHERRPASPASTPRATDTPAPSPRPNSRVRDRTDRSAGPAPRIQGVRPAARRPATRRRAACRQPSAASTDETPDPPDCLR